MKIVIKLGGQVFSQNAAAGIEHIVSDLFELRANGYQPILVHGGGVLIDKALKSEGIEPQKKDGLRITTTATMKVVQHVLDGINTVLCEEFNALGLQSYGFNSQNAVLQASQKYAIGIDGIEFDLGLVGSITSVNKNAILSAVESCFVPLIAPLAIAQDNHHLLFNVNADDVACAVAEQVNAEMLVFMSDVPGVIGANNIGVKTLRKAHSDHLSGIGAITGGMRAKLHNAFRAAENGVKCVQIIDGTQPHSLLESINTPGANGTLIAC